MFKITKKELFRLYVEESMNQKEIADLKDTSRATIGRRMKKYNIKARNLPLTGKEYRKKVNSAHNGEMIILNNYISMNENIKVKHKICGHEWATVARNLIEGHGCPKCAGNIKLKDDEFKRRVKEIWGDKFTVLGIYKGANEKILVRHEVCGFEFTPFASNLTKGQGCPKCRPKVIGDVLRKDHDTFIKEIYDLVGEEYTVVGQYKTTHDKILMKHNECGHKWKVQPAHFLSGTRCPLCAKSEPEKRTREWLDENNYKYEQEAIFNECRNIKPLPFDFKIYKNKNKFILIEIDGVFHYKPIYGHKRLNKVKENDKIKNKFCFHNNIPLIRIPYWEFDNIEKILEKELTS